MKNRRRAFESVVASFLILLSAVSQASSFGPPPKELLERKGLDTSLESLESYALDISLEPDIRMLALHAIRDENDRQSVDIVIHLLYDSNPDIRLFAASTLSFLKDEKSVPHFVSFLKVEQIPSAYGVALNGLALLATEDAVSGLFDVAQDVQAPGIQRSTAIHMIAALARAGTVDSARIGNELATGLLDSDPEIRAMTAHAMTSTGVSMPIEHLVAAAKDERISSLARITVIREIERVSGEDFGFSRGSSAEAMNSDAILKMETWWANEQSKLNSNSATGVSESQDVGVVLLWTPSLTFRSVIAQAKLRVPLDGV